MVLCFEEGGGRKGLGTRVVRGWCGLAVPYDLPDIDLNPEWLQRLHRIDELLLDRHGHPVALRPVRRVEHSHS